MKFTTEIETKVRGIGQDVTDSISISASKDVNLAMVRWMSEVIELTKANIERTDAKATLNLLQSVDFADLPVEAKVAQVAMEMATYWKFVEYGVNGVQTNRGAPFSFRSITPSPRHVAAIRKWAVDRSLGIPADEIDAAAYNIARAIKRRGIKPRPFLNPVLTDAKLDELVSSIAQVAGKEISLSMNV
jgi:hypothetical protein